MEAINWYPCARSKVDTIYPVAQWGEGCQPMRAIAVPTVQPTLAPIGHLPPWQGGRTAPYFAKLASKAVLASNDASSSDRAFIQSTSELHRFSSNEPTG
jgi:hypothetical protein